MAFRWKVLENLARAKMKSKYDNNPIRLGFLASGSGSNFQAIIDNIANGKLNAVAALLISNNSKAYALERAAQNNIPCFHISSAKFPNQNDLDNEIIRLLDEHKIDILILAGYMKMLSSKIIHFMESRVLNIHPALLPKYGGHGMYGMNVHKAVCEAKENISGATVHLVDDEYDRGRILKQMEVMIDENDSAEQIAEKVLKIEHILFSETLIDIVEDRIII